MQEITALRRAEQRISFSYGLTYAVLGVHILYVSSLTASSSSCQIFHCSGS